MYISGGKHVHMNEGKKPRWTIASARQNLPEVVTLAAREPQDIYRRNELVARVVAPGAQAGVREHPSAAALLAEIQRVCADENYTLAVPARVDRPNPFANHAKPKRGRRRTT
jgi:hypothetical protein